MPLGVGVRPRRLAAADRPGQRVAGDPPAVPRHEELRRGAEEGAVGHREREDRAVGLVRPQAAQDGGEGEIPAQLGGHTAGQDDLVELGAGRVHGGHRPGHQLAVAGTREGRGESGDRHIGRRTGVGRAIAGRAIGRPAAVAVLPDHRVEQLVGRGQGQVEGPHGRGPSMCGPVGLAPDTHGEAGDDEVALEGGEEGEGAQGHDPRARTLHRVVAGDGREEGGGVPGLHQDGGAPPHQGEPGPVEEHGRAAVELQGVGTVVQRHRAGVQVGAGHGGVTAVMARSWRGTADPGGKEELAESSREGVDTDTGVARLAQHAAQNR